ncbi:MAG: AI-2E family transporter [Treponema sp.]|nr:AI-2E family transporter [Treponema sp.]
MSNKLDPGKLKSLLPYFLLALAVILTYKVVSQISFFANIIGTLWKIVTPFLYGFIIAYIVNIPYGGIKKILGKSKIKLIIKLKKPLSIIITLIFFALIIFSVLYLIIPYIIKSISFFITTLPSYYERIQGTIEYINSLEFLGIHISAEGILNILQEMFQNISVENFSSTITAIFGVGSAIFTGILALISSIYILAEKQKFKNFLSRMLAAFTPDNVHKSILDYAGKLNRNFKRYIHIQTIDGLILGTIVTIELLILRSPYALFLGIMLGIVNYIPYFGSIFGSIIVVIIVAFTQGIVIALIAAVVLLITQQIDGNIIQPRLMGGSFSLSPLLIIISITIGGALAGIFGMIAAIPIISVLKDMLENIIKYYERKKQVLKPPDSK